MNKKTLLSFNLALMLSLSSMAQLADIWYTSHGASYGRSHHYNDSRYHMLNLHATFTKGEAQVKEVEDAFSKLPSQIDLIKGYEWGTDCSPEGLQQGLTHCFFLTFHSDADRDAYLVHPAHKAFGKVLGGKASAVTVLDYWTK